MKRLLCISVSFILLCLMINKSFSQDVSKSRTNVEVLFTATMTRDSLEKIKASMKEKNIQLEFLETEFDKDGHLKMLSFRVNCNDGFTGQAANKDFSKNKRFGFFRNYGKKAKTPFGVGLI
jgi:hypothetical protein